MRMKDEVYPASIRRCFLYGCEIWIMLDSRIEMTEMRMIRWMCGVSLKERQPSIGQRGRLGVEAIGDVVRRCRLRWHGHVERKNDASYVKACTRLVVEGGCACRKAEEDTVLRHASDTWNVHDRK